MISTNKALNQGNAIRQKMFPGLVRQAPKPAQNQNNNGNITYSKFSQFAVNKQKEEKQKQIIIQQAIKDALSSHIRALQFYAKIDNKITQQHQTCRTQLSTILGDISGIDLKQVFQDPIKIFKNPSEILLKTPFKEVVLKYLNLLKIMQRYYIIDGRLIKNDKLLLGQFVSQQSNYFIPTLLNPNLFVKIHNDKKTSEYVYLKQGKFQSKDIINKISQKQKEVIMLNVTQYLQKNGVLDPKTRDQRIFLQKFQNIFSKMNQSKPSAN